VNDDGSLGVHNPKYTAALLRASIDDLKGGIDVDHDGLPDSWEIANFGSITAQSGSDDADGDGLSNAQEKALGTNPSAKDSDNDGVWDGTEIQAGSNPLSKASHPGTNMVTILPTVELGYFPDTIGVPYQFQAIDLLAKPGGWYTIGSGFVSSNAWFYQLITPRDAESKHFRVITAP
ncbi:MAG: thrombospondin type 3 repeat-containing protein, partial [bacterium]